MHASLFSCIGLLQINGLLVPKPRILLSLFIMPSILFPLRINEAIYFRGVQNNVLYILMDILLAINLCKFLLLEKVVKINQLQKQLVSIFCLLVRYEPHHEKTCFCTFKIKSADQQRSNRAADQRLCFR